MKLSDRQISALARIASGSIEVRCEFFYGVARTSALALERRGLVTTKGVREPKWMLTDEGRSEVADCLRDGRIIKTMRELPEEL